MKSITLGHADKFRKCPICSEQIRTLEPCWVVDRNGKVSQAYCDTHSLEDVLIEHPDAVEPDEDDGESHLRSMEDFAAYKYAGNTEAYWSDRDAGYAN